ncbi:C4b-binding protein alpha chain [Python bivittatus]|uniref:C4b-binding protein alpha chain n=1 Tax=Python bivittatus TaxID=176946 RepID=A0A9F5IQV8_PYTBI|nr:C4b-binding protein alpha chain [Python bivittatus]
MSRRRPSRLLAILALAALTLTLAWPVDGSKDFEPLGIRSAEKSTDLHKTDHCLIANLPVFEGSEPAFSFPAISYYHRIIYKCKVGFKPVTGNVSVMRCHRGSWKPVKDFCRRIYCREPPNIIDGFHNGNASTYPYGTIINYSCNKNLSLIGPSSISCSGNRDLTGRWKGKPPICQVVFCKDPVVEHGIKITGFEKSYMYGSNVAFQCKIGYFMVGNPLIRCEKNSSWVPKVPSCKKISAYICGAPLILNGNIQPLQPHYESGKKVAISCNLNYSFIDDTTMMTIQCEGYNLWNPPAQLCVFRTSPDTSHLFVYHGTIVHGRKNKYKPGDEVVIECHAGYILIGPSRIKYIGGKKWFPRVPGCHLSAFLKLLILGCLLPILILAIKMFYQKYLQKR